MKNVKSTKKTAAEMAAEADATERAAKHAEKLRVKAAIQAEQDAAVAARAKRAADDLESGKVLADSLLRSSKKAHKEARFNAHLERERARLAAAHVALKAEKAQSILEQDMAAVPNPDSSVVADMNGEVIVKAPKASKKASFSRHNQPVKCGMCGKLTTWSEANGNTGLDLCQPCFDAATIENAHLDGHHTEPVDNCLMCVCVEAVAPKVDARMNTQRLNAHEEGLHTEFVPACPLCQMEAKVAVRVAQKALGAEIKQGRKKASDAAVSEALAEAFVAGKPLPSHQELKAAGKKAENEAGIMARVMTAGLTKKAIKKLASKQVVALPEPLKQALQAATTKSPKAMVKDIEKALDAQEAADAKEVARIAADTKAHLKAQKEAVALAKKLGKQSAKGLKKATGATEVTVTEITGPVGAPVVGKVVKAGKKASKKPVEPAADALTLRLYAKGHFWLPKNTAALLGDLPYVQITVSGNTVNIAPTKSKKDSQPVRFSHGNPQISAAKLLATTTWNKQTQTLPVTLVGNVLCVEVQ